MTIGEYELAVLKAIHLAGGRLNIDEPSVDVVCSITGDLDNAVSRLCEDEYMELDAATYRLTDLATEYLELLGMF